jgi:glycosyltransferase involved in cell wall biosynthesis
MRGIGYTTANFLRSIPKGSSDHFVLFVHARDDDSLDFIKGLLAIPEAKFEFRSFAPSLTEEPTNGQLGFVVKAMQKLSYLGSYRLGSAQFGDVHDIDRFIQFDQNQPMPQLPRKSKNFLIAYDLIPYVLETDYLWGYHTSRQHGRTRRSALKSAFNRSIYIKKVAFNTRFADKVIAISQTTKRDLIKYAKTPAKKISVTLLGVNRAEKTSDNPATITRYVESSWGYLPESSSLDKKKFLLFVGGADNRRRLTDLVAAFNQLKAKGSDIKLVLSGDTMKSPLAIPSQKVQKALLSSPYKNDIYFLGFTDDDTKNWLYKNTSAFVFPSIYEGFGLPILEAMELEAPVICYDTPAVREVGGEIPFYATDVMSLVESIEHVEALSTAERDKLKKRGTKHSEQFSWDSTTKEILATVTK